MVHNLKKNMEVKGLCESNSSFKICLVDMCDPFPVEFDKIFSKLSVNILG